MENNRTDLRSKSNVGADLNKKMDESQQCMEHLQRVVETGEGTEDTYGTRCVISKFETS